ncbi:DsrE family protein [Mucilaginibacter sp. 10I4]|uniref:DsrE family protein n=1 Tax=Mucilaginibacter sp. 10I4 TaxID=3048580 RepID=UPI002B22C27F|nr:DsrE family protein [Mucilaginibacter sp. 10I4]MEB0249942.1 DsrE family protein [Mucilaginibacter sp. 5B2]MEB0260727.1 DsrE family protein [Mucilaginibacter sp. 10I4]
MKNLLFSLFALTVFFASKPAFAQSAQSDFKGAEATKSHYKALYYLDDADPKKIKGTLRNIDNALEDVRLKGKVEIELVAFSDGVAVYDKSGPFEATLLALQKKGVILAQCNNTVMERHIDKASLFPFISYVPSGNGEIIIRQAEGWATIHP